MLLYLYLLKCRVLICLYIIESVFNYTPPCFHEPDLTRCSQMDTSHLETQQRKINYCLCGVVLLDETGTVTAVSQDFFETTNLKIILGEALPDELQKMEPGQRIFLGQDLFIQTEGRQWLEVIVVRRIRTADQILAPYGENAINEKMVRMVLDNPYEGLMVVDTQGKLTLLSPSNERWFGLDVGGAVGMPLTDLAPASHVVDVAKTGVAECAQVVDLQGKTKITVNLPIRRDKDKEVIGAFAKILFQSTEQVKQLADRVRTVERQVECYETLLDEMRGERYTFENIITNNEAMLGIINQARRIADSSANVLILGESGTGKELFAQALHEASNRKKGPFIAINCSAIPRDLIESELFGYEHGAFSGTKSKGKPGKFELASGGTLFLDELGELPLDSQAKLLRVLEERKIDRLGGTFSIPVDFRLIAATNCNLGVYVNTGKFRSDLYYRINEYPLEIPPLRARKMDIPTLARKFLTEVCQRERLPKLKLSDSACEVLMTYDWPGNVRELRGLMRQMAWKTDGLIIEPHHLPASLNKGQVFAVSGTMEEQISKSERAIIESALQACGGNRGLAAESLGIHRTALYKKMKKLGMA